MYLNPSSTASFSGRVGLCSRLCDFPARERRRRGRVSFSDVDMVRFRPVKASTEQSSGEAVDARGSEGESRQGFTSPAMEVTTLDSFKDTEFPVWEKIGAVVRLSYGIGQFLILFCLVSSLLRFFQLNFDVIFGG